MHNVSGVPPAKLRVMEPIDVSTPAQLTGATTQQGSDRTVVTLDKTHTLKSETGGIYHAPAGSRVIFQRGQILLEPPTTHEVVKMAGQSIEKAAEHQYTLGAWYIPNSPENPDAHDHWTDAETLQKAAWNYARNGWRTVWLQHGFEPAGEWVEIISWPQEVTFTKPNGSTVTYPPGTVFLGVLWNDWAWALVKEGHVSGLSIGGRVLFEGDE